MVGVDILLVHRPAGGQQQRVRFTYNRFVSDEDVQHNVALDAGDTPIIR